MHAAADTIFASFEGKGVAFCYEKQHINRLKSMRFPKYIPTERGESGKLELSHFYVFNLTLNSPIR